MDVVKDKMDVGILANCIDYWEKIVSTKVDCTGVKGCALCDEYYFEDDCQGCPIYEDTGKDECQGTPFGRFKAYAKDSDYAKVSGKIAVSDFESKKLANDMLLYLTDLSRRINERSLCFRVGDYFKIADNIYILHSPNMHTAVLTNIITGGRWSGSVQISDVDNISIEEFKEKLVGKHSYERIDRSRVKINY